MAGLWISGAVLTLAAIQSPIGIPMAIIGMTHVYGPKKNQYFFLGVPKEIRE
jgi:hypothetical protein